MALWRLPDAMAVGQAAARSEKRALRAVVGSFESSYVCRISWAHHSREPFRPAKHPQTSHTARQSFPSLVDIERQIGVHKDVSVTIVLSGTLHTHHLMPAMHAANWVRVHGERDVLMDPGVIPPDACAIGIIALIRLNAAHLTHLPLPFSDFPEINQRARKAFDLIILVYAPSP